MRFLERIGLNKARSKPQAQRQEQPIEPAIRMPDRVAAFVVRDINLPIPNHLLRPDYHDYPGGSNPRTVFLAQGYEMFDGMVDGVQYNDERGLHTLFGTERISRAENLARERTGTTNTAAYFQEYLRERAGNDKLELVHLQTGVNASTGVNYTVFGFKIPQLEQK